MELNKSHASSMFKKNVRKFTRNKLAMMGLIVVTAILLLCIFAPFITPYRADKPDFSALIVINCPDFYCNCILNIFIR